MTTESILVRFVWADGYVDRIKLPFPLPPVFRRPENDRPDRYDKWFLDHVSFDKSTVMYMPDWCVVDFRLRSRSDGYLWYEEQR